MSSESEAKRRRKSMENDNSRHVPASPDEFLTGVAFTRKFDRRSVSHDDRLNVFYGQGMVALMSGNSAARRHFGFVQVAHCAWADDKATDKSQNSTWLASFV